MKKGFSAAGICLLALVCFSHEYILLAENYRLKRGEGLVLHLFVADGFNIELERSFQKIPTQAFELITPNGTTDLSGPEGTLPIARRTVDFEGGGLVHLERGYAYISLGTPKFLDYLKEDHLEGIAPKVDRTKAEQRERYTRYIKCLVQSGNTFADTLYKRIIGQRFEIVLLNNPYQLQPGSALSAKVLFDGKPLVRKVITARNRTGNLPATALTARTNAQGICTFKLPRKGEWFLHATHMIEGPNKADSDWESFWTAYSFALDK